MYKDVWKKFGWKMLIAVCSVLLLGGVAFAAPRLQAEEEVEESDEAGSQVLMLEESTAAESEKIKLSDCSPENFEVPMLRYNQAEQEITTITYEKDGQNITLSTPQDFSYHWESGGTNAGEAKLVIAPSFRSDSKIESESGANVTLTVEIKKQEIQTFYSKKFGADYSYALRVKVASGSDEKDYLEVTGQDYVLKKNQVTIEVYRAPDGDVVDTWSEEKNENEYSLAADATLNGTNKAGIREFTVRLTNFTYNSENYIKGEVKVKKDIGHLSMVITAPAITKPLSPTVAIYDGEKIKDNELKQGRSGSSSADYWYTCRQDDRDKTKYWVEAYAIDGSNYVGTHKDSYTLTGTKKIEKLEGTDGFLSFFDYDSKNGYIQDIKKLKNVASDGSTKAILDEGIDYEISEYGVVNYRGQILDGATAGTVRATITGIGDYAGQTGSVEYHVSRSLKNAKIIFDPAEPSYEYDKTGILHKPEMKVVFGDKPDYALIPNTDYEIKYSNDKGGGEGAQSEEGNLRDAGTITVKVTGTGTQGEYGSGYYDSTSNKYVIRPKEISEESGYKLILDKADNDNDGVPDFEYTGSLPDFPKAARIVRITASDDAINVNNDLERGKDYTITTTSGGSKVGEHEVTFRFKGNYTGSISAKYEICAYDLSKCDIVIESCSCGDSGDEHGYTGEKHIPKVRVYQEGGKTEIPEDTYTLSYGENTKVGMATVTVTSKADKSNSKTKEFEIVQRSIGDEQDHRQLIMQVSETEYFGPDTAPKITEMKYGNIILNPSDYEITDIIPTGAAIQGATRWHDPEFPTMKTESSIEYVVQIQAKDTSNFVGKATTVNTVTFVPRNIEPEGRIEIQSPSDTTEALTSGDEILKHAKEVALQDLQLKRKLQQKKDYDVAAKNDKGIVTVTMKGKGHYKGTKTTIFHMGTNIASVDVYEGSAKRGNGLAGPVRLAGNYPYEPLKEKYLNFVSGSAVSGNGISLRSGTKYLTEAKDEREDGDYRVYYKETALEGDQLWGVVQIEGTGKSYYGTMEIRYKITRKRLADVQMSFKSPAAVKYVYNGREQNPEVELEDGKYPLVEGKDYTIVYKNNKHHGNARITATGIGNYQGTKELSFEIKQKPFEEKTQSGGSIVLIGMKESYGYTLDPDGVRPADEAGFEVRDMDIADDGEDGAGTAYTTLVKDKDYQVTYKNNKEVGTKAAITLTAAAGSDYSGSISKNFEITGIALADCDVDVTNARWDFTGEAVQLPKESLIVRYGGKVIPADEFDLACFNNTRVGEATVRVTPKSPSSILLGSKDEKFQIIGTLGEDVKNKSGAAISNTTNNEQSADYSADAPQAPKADITFEATYLDGGLVVSDGQKVQKEKIHLDEGKDYTIVTSSDTSVIGVHNITIQGVEGGFYTGQFGTKFTVWGDLSKITEDNYEPFGTVQYKSGAAVYPDLVITYGGKRLKEGEDYQIEDNPKQNHREIGPAQMTIKPTTASALYLKNEKTFDYRITASIEGDDLAVSGLEESYTYKHGKPVVTEDDIVVSLGKTKLSPAKDYEVQITGNINVGKGTVTVTGINNYSGTAVKNFVINPYDLAEHDQTPMKVTYDEEQIYTGSTIVPEVTEIRDASGAAINLDEIDVIAGSQGDHVNVTPAAEGAVKPDFIVRPTTSNYTGQLSRAFRIIPKSLSQEGITVAAITDRPYANGKEIKPVPQIMHGTKSLKGVEFAEGKTDEEYIAEGGNFVYQYMASDLRHPGDIQISVRGVGNYNGKISVPFKIIKKKITDEDVTVVFDFEKTEPDAAPVNPVYNGGVQIPAFNLMYLGESILRWDGLKLIDQGNQYMSLLTTTVEPGENATNAGNASFIIKTTNNDKSDPYYEGERTVQFTIDKLQIQDYTKFFYRPTGQDAIELKKDGYKLSYEFKEKTTVKPVFASDRESGELAEEQVGVYYNNGVLNIPLFSDGENANKDNDYTVEYAYVEPDTDDTPIREEYSNPDPELSYAGKVKVTISGQNNYSGSASFWYYIGADISAEGASSLQKTTTVFNAQQQWPVEVVSGLDASKYRIVRYRHAVTEENILGEKPVKGKEGGDTKAFIDADTYYVRIEGKPEAGTYSSKPIQLTYTIQPRSINRVLIDGYKAEYQYTGSAVCPTGLTVTDPIDEIRYKLTENKDYTVSYSNNINAGVASIIIKGQGNYDSGTTATARFTITSSTISSGSSGGNGGGGSSGSSDGSSGQLAGPSAAISADDVRLTMDTSDAMYYTGSAVYPGVYISGMTENIDYTVTFSNNINVGQGIVTIRGINNSSGVITKTFRIIGDLAKCSVAAIPDQAYTGLAVTPGVTVTCGTSTLLQGTDYTLSYANNINIGTASVVITAARDSNYVGSVTVNFSIGNGVSSAVVSGYASHYTYTGEPITPAISVVAGSATLRPGTDYTVEYADNTNAGTATITITGKGTYSGTQKVTFVIEPKSIASCTTTDVSGKKYTGDAYTPAVTVSDGGKTLTNGVDYTVTYANNTNPGVASIIIRALNDNYTGTKTINFRIGTVAVSNFHAGNIKSTSMTLAWTAQDYASGYQICDANSRVVKNSTKNKVTLTGLTSGKTYKYKVRSFIRRADGTRAYGSFSTVISATTKLKTPTVKAASTGKNKARIRWSKVTGATGYQIYYSKSATKGFKKLKTTKNTVRTLNIKGLSSGQRYFFRVRAYKRVGSKNIYSNYNSLKAITVK